jgi:hypothetical protein
MNDTLALGLIIADFGRSDDFQGMWEALRTVYERDSTLQELAAELLQADDEFIAEKAA